MLEFGYSPFSDKDENKKNIFNLTFDDLSQLQTKEIEEGQQIEYKREFNSSVKKKIPKIITSFANESGGWLFFGIANKTREFFLIENNSYEEIINQLLKDHTNPIPKFEIKFLRPNPSSKEGILVVWIPEGTDPPYIADGNIFVRIGSISSPIKDDEDLFVVIKDRFYLDRLYQKSKDRNQEINDFCNKKISIHNKISTDTFGINFTDVGMCNIYIIPMYKQNLMEILGSDEEIINIFLTESKILRTYSIESNFSFGMNIEFKKATLSYNSIIFRSSDVLDHFQSTVAWEQFFNGRAKFHIPLPHYSNQEDIIKKIMQSGLKYENAKVFSKFQYINGESFLEILIACLGAYFNTMKKVIPDFNEFFIVFELDNIDKDVLFFDQENYLKLIKEKGLVFSDKKVIQIELYKNIPLKVDEKNLLFYLNFIIHVFRSFGYTHKEFVNFFFAKMTKHSKST